MSPKKNQKEKDEEVKEKTRETPAFWASFTLTYINTQVQEKDWGEEGFLARARQFCYCLFIGEGVLGERGGRREVRREARPGGLG